MAKERRRVHVVHGLAKVIRTAFGGMRIVDANADTTLLVNTTDIKAAAGHEKDATNCVLAKACRRQVGATIAAFFRRVAYLDLPDAKGKRSVVRFELGADAAAIVRAFDSGKTVRGEVSVTLKAPRKSCRLDAIRKRSRRAMNRKRKAIIKGELKEFGKSARLFRKPQTIDIRNGTGMVHNIIKKAKS